MTEHSFISFGGLLRQLRAEAGLTQEALADAAGLSARTVSDLERGVNSTARKESARLLADALGLTGQAREDFEVVARGRGPSQEPIVRTRLPPTAPQRTAAGGVLLPDGPMQVVVGEIPREPPGFVSRGLLGQIKDAAEQRQVAVVCAVTGLRGVGKTQVAAAYARARIADGCSLVGWVNAGTTGGMLAGLARVADRLGVADPDGDSVESAARLREYLNARPEPGLLVFDNAVDMDGLRHNLPAAGGTQLVITSTDRRFAELGAALDVSVFARPESLGYLADRTGLADEAGANAVAAALGDLPLGLAQAAAAIRGQHLTYQGYLQRLRRVPVADLLGRVPGGDYPHATAASLLLSIQDVEAGEDAGLVSRILRVAAALSANGVRRELLSDLAAEEPDDSSVMVDAAIERCVAGSLLTWSVTGDAVIMHILMSRVLREREKAAGRWDRTVTAVLDVLESRLFPEGAAWARREEGADLVTHIEALREADLGDAHQPSLVLRLQRARCWAVRQLTAATDLSLAINLGVHTMADCERLLGDDHLETMTARNNLAMAYRAAGRLSDAIPLYESVLANGEQIFGANHPDTWLFRNNLACAYEAAGRLSDAIPLLEAIQAHWQQAMGEDHPHTLVSQNNLAYTYRAAGQLAKATSIYQAALATGERILGAEHPQTLTIRNNLAYAYRAAGRIGEAISLLEAIAAIRTRVLGREHHQTLTSCSDLAGAYRAAGQLSEAIALYQQTLTDWERLLGEGHPDTLVTRNDLAYAYDSAGRHIEAIALFETSLADSEQVLGSDHPITLTFQNNLAHAYESVGRTTEALRIYKRCLADRERVLSHNHPNTLISRSNVARVYLSMGRVDEAITLLDAVHADYERVLSGDHTDTLASRSNIACARLSAGQAGDAIPLVEAALADCERVLGDDHPDTLASRNNVACAYLLAGRIDSAIGLMEAALGDCERVLGEDHPHTLALRSNLTAGRHFHVRGSKQLRPA